MTNVRPTIVTVDLNAIAHNVRIAKQYAPHAMLCAVVKADAYGHGLIPVSKAMLNAGATWIAVATVEEGIALRQADVHAPILVMAGALCGAYEAIIKYRLTPAISTQEDLAGMGQAAVALHAAHQDVPIHIEVDSGMSRLGVPLENFADFLKQLHKYPALYLQGVMSHMSMADTQGTPYNAEQTQRWLLIQNILQHANMHVDILHIANGPSTVSMPNLHMNMVRCGILLYGLQPMQQQVIPQLQPAARWSTRIICLRDLPKDTPVSYNGTWCTTRTSRIATLSVGYADGYRRNLSNKAYVLVHGMRAPVIGNVCMDLCMIDVTDIPHVALGDEVILLGQQQNQRITAEEMAQWSNTIAYEVVCAISSRVPRYYTTDACL